MRWRSFACAKHCGLKNQQIQSRVRHVQGQSNAGWKCAASRRCDRGGRFWPSSHGPPRDAEGPAAEISARENLGHLRAALEHDAAKCFSIRTGHGPLPRRCPSWLRKWRVWNRSRPEERLNPEKLMQDLKTAGKNAAYLPDVDAIVAHVAKSAQGGDIVVVSATAVSAGFTPNCWSGWGGDDGDQASPADFPDFLLRTCSKCGGRLPSLPVTSGSSREFTGELAAGCRLHWQPRWLPPHFRQAPRTTAAHRHGRNRNWRLWPWGP